VKWCITRVRFALRTFSTPVRDVPERRTLFDCARLRLAARRLRRDRYRPEREGGR
jgi:hypothetical protein